MRSWKVRPVLSPLKGKINLAGDKSIAHRAIILSALSSGKTVIKNFPANKDCQTTLSAIQKLGIKIEKTRFKPYTINVTGRGLFGLRKPAGDIFVNESGTTFRLLLGVLAGQDFEVTLKAAESLSRRPMQRVNAPLRLMGAVINARRSTPGSKPQEEYPPVKIRGGKLRSITYKLPVASAQVKSAILLAGLYASGISRIIEPLKTRNHTELMLGLFGADIKVNKNNIVIKGGQNLVSPMQLYVPGDISSAAFFIILAALSPQARIIIPGCGINPSRAGIIRVLIRMGMNLELRPGKISPGKAGIKKPKVMEPMGDIIAQSSKLKGALIKKNQIPSLIDELPILMVAASLAKGKTIFQGVGELRVKETDRINSMCVNLRKMGADIQVVQRGKSENIIIQGVEQLKAAKVKSFGDHRTAMSMVVAGLVADGQTEIDDVSCINKSFPEFLSIIRKLTQKNPGGI